METPETRGGEAGRADASQAPRLGMDAVKLFSQAELKIVKNSWWQVLGVRHIHVRAVRPSRTGPGGRDPALPTPKCPHPGNLYRFIEHTLYASFGQPPNLVLGPG